MSLEKEIIVVIPLQSREISLPKKHREVLIFDEVFNDLNKTQPDTTTLFWDLALASYSENGYVFSNYKEVLPYVKTPNQLKDFFELGVGKRIRLVNKNLLNDLTSDDFLLKETLEERILFLKELGAVQEQYNAVNFLIQKDLIDEHLIIMSSIDSIEFVGQEKDKRLVHVINDNLEHDPYLTYFSYYNSSSDVYLKNEYQVIDSLDRIETTQPSSMNDIWLNNQTSFIELMEAKLKVFANVVTSENQDVNTYFVDKDLTVDLQNAGLRYLALGNTQRRYNNNNINNLALQFDNVLLDYKERTIIERYQPTEWLRVEDQKQDSIDNKIVKGFVCQYSLAPEVAGVEVGLQGNFNAIEG